MSLLKMAVKLSLNASKYYKSLDEVEGKTQKVALTLNNAFGYAFSAKMAVRFAREIAAAIDKIPESVSGDRLAGKKVSAERQANAATIANTSWMGSIRSGDTEHTGFFEEQAAGWKVLGSLAVDAAKLLYTASAESVGLKKRGSTKTQYNAVREWFDSSRSEVDDVDKQWMQRVKTHNAMLKQEADLKKKQNDEKQKELNALNKEKEQSFVSGLSEADQVKYHIAKRMALLGSSAATEKEKVQNATEAEQELQKAYSLLKDRNTSAVLGFYTSKRVSGQGRVAGEAASPESMQKLESAANDFKDAVQNFIRGTTRGDFE